MATVGSLLVKIGADLSELRKSMKDASSILQGAGKDMMSVGKSMTNNLTRPIVGFAQSVLETAQEFETNMNRVKALTGETGDALLSMRDKAKELGSTTKFTATEAADAMGFMAMAGFETDEILTAIGPTLNLAAAGMTDIGDAADIVTNVMSGFGIPAEEVGTAVDRLTHTFTNSNTSLQQLGKAFSYAGPVAKTAGMSFSDTAAVLGKMGDAGIQSTRAGTALAGALNRLQNPTRSNAELIARLGDSLDGVGEPGFDFVGVLERIQEEGFTGADILKLFGQRAGPALQALLVGGTEGIRELSGEIEHSEGAADSARKTMEEGWPGAIIKLTSAWEGLKLAIAEAGLMELATDLVKWVTELIRKATELDPIFIQIGAVIAIVVAALGPLVIALGGIVWAVGVLWPVLVAIGTAFAAVGAASAAVAIAIGAILGALVAVIVYWDEWNMLVQETMTDILLWLEENLGWLGEFIVESFTRTFSESFDAIDKGWSAIKQAWETWTTDIHGDQASFTQILSDNWSITWATIKDLAGQAWAWLKETSKATWEWMKDTASSLWDGLKEAVTGALDGIKTGAKNVWDGMKTTALSAWEGIKTGIVAVLNFIGGKLNEALDWANSVISAINSIPGVSIPLINWRVPEFAMGGLVMGPTLGLIGESGPEAVIPLDRLDEMFPGGGGGGAGVMEISGPMITGPEIIRWFRDGVYKFKIRNVTSGIE